MTPGHVSLRRVTPASKAVSGGFREQVMWKLALKEAQNLHVSWRFRKGCCQRVRAQVEAWRVVSSHVVTGSGSVWLLMVTLSIGMVNP